MERRSVEARRRPGGICFPHPSLPCRFVDAAWREKSRQALDSRPDGILIAPVLTDVSNEFCKSIPETIKLDLDPATKECWIYDVHERSIFGGN